MGIDVEIYFETEPGAPVPVFSDDYDFKIVSLAGDPDVRRDAEGNLPTHHVQTFRRYYGPGYERGSWPVICAVLMRLFATQGMKRVWYFGDSGEIEDRKPMTIDDVLELSRHYMTNCNRPYDALFRRY